MNEEVIEVFNAKESAEILKRCEAKIEKAHAELQRGEKLNEGLRFTLGVQMLTAKPHIPHGQFGDWLKERFPTIELRTAQNYMRFVEASVTAAGRSKNETVSFLKDAPKQLTQGEFDWTADLQVLSDALSTLMKGQGMMEFIEKHAGRKVPGGAQRIGFTCPKCQAALKGLVGRKVQCGACGEVSVAKADTFLDSKRAAQEADEALYAAAGTIRSIVSRMDDAAGEFAQAHTEAVQAFLLACQEASTQARHRKLIR